MLVWAPFAPSGEVVVSHLALSMRHMTFKREVHRSRWCLVGKLEDGEIAIVAWLDEVKTKVVASFCKSPALIKKFCLFLKATLKIFPRFKKHPQCQRIAPEGSQCLTVLKANVVVLKAALENGLQWRLSNECPSDS